MKHPRRRFLRNSVAAVGLPLARFQDPAAPALPAAGFVDVDGIRTRYFEGGSGPNLVLIHGGRFGTSSYSADVWGLSFGPLSRHFRVFAFDKLGMGYTDNPLRDADYTKRAYVRHAAGFIRRMGIRRTTLLGHSMGALVAARIAVEQPELVENLILLDSNTLAPPGPSTPRGFYSRLLDENVPHTPTLEYVRREPDANSYSNHHVSRDYLQAILKIARLPKSIQATAKAGLLNQQLFADIGEVKAATLASIRAGELRAPTLILWGFNDVSAPVILGHHLMQVVAPAVARTQFLVLNRAGHYLFREKPAELNRVVIRFIEDGSAL